MRKKPFCIVSAKVGSRWISSMKSKSVTCKESKVGLAACIYIFTYVGLLILPSLFGCLLSYLSSLAFKKSLYSLLPSSTTFSRILSVRETLSTYPT